MKDKEFVRKALETHIEALERSIGLRASAVLSKGQTLLVLHQLKEHYPVEVSSAAKLKPTNKTSKSKMSSEDLAKGILGKGK